MCRKIVTEVIRCKKCAPGCYYSDICSIKNNRDHQQICSAIVELENLEKDKIIQRNKNSEIGSHLPLKLNCEIIRLVGARPLINVKLSKVNCKCLWDMGSMVSDK